MAAETARLDLRTWSADQWQAVIGGGLIAGVVMGLMIRFVMGIMPLIGALYGMETALAGWIAHLIHSVVFAALFAAIIAQLGLAGGRSSTWRWLGLGAGYGVLVWLVAAVFVMPVWLSLVGAAPAGASIPNINPQSLVGHLVFGVVLGFVYPRLA